MNCKNQITNVLFIVFSLQFGLYAQESSNTAGGNASGFGGTVSYSIGQIVYTTQKGNIGSVAQGVQQPYEISVVSEIKDISQATVSILVFPNPTLDDINLRIENQNHGNWIYELRDVGGKLLQKQALLLPETPISLSEEASGVYFLKVSESNHFIKVFKIIKN